MSEKQTPKPWDNERVIAEAETIAESYVTLDNDQRRKEGNDE